MVYSHKMTATDHRSRAAFKGLHQFLDDEQQRGWLNGEADLDDADERHDSLEQRFKYAGRFDKLLHRPFAGELIEILRAYAASCIPIPRATERFYWSVSCLPGSPDKPLARINASWMELFALQPDKPSPLWGGLGGGSTMSLSAADAAGRPLPRSSPARGEDLSARFILHLSDFTTDGSIDPGQLDTALLAGCVDDPGNVTHFFWKADTFGVKVRSAASIGKFLAHPYARRAIRRFNLTHMNRGRNAYQGSHCYSLADQMLD